MGFTAHSQPTPEEIFVKMFLKSVLAAAFCVLAALGAGCDYSPAGLPMVSMQIGKQVFHLEVAATSETMEKGLMQRDSMPSDHGMIFVFPDEQERQFWMKNTRIPLDILFLSSRGKVVSIHQMIPYDRDLTPSDGAAQYAIELNNGAAAAAGVKPGDILQIPAAATAK